MLIETIAELGSGHWVAWWYGGLKRNEMAPGEMLVAVNFRRITGAEPRGVTVTKDIGVTQIGQVPLGSIWLRGERVRKLKFIKRTFEVNFTAEPEQFLTLRGCSDEEIISAFREKRPPLVYTDDVDKTILKPVTNERSHLIKLATAENHLLFLPCMELFSRLYGRSAEVKRVLVGYPWIEGANGAIGRLYADIDEARSSNIWKVKLQRRAVNADVVFLAHAKYDPFTIAAIKTIHAQIVVHNGGPGAFEPHYPIIRPWFEGAVSLMVEGVELNDRMFLGLRIMGASDPDGLLIERDRVDRDRISREKTDDERDGFESNATKKIRARIKPPIVNLTSEEEPDQGSSIVEIEDDSFRIIGSRRPVIDRPARIVKQGVRAVSILGKGDETRFSGGAEFGSGKGVGAAYIQAPEVVESLGVQIGMWNALIELSRIYAERISPVEWYTFDDGFNSIGPPKQIPFAEYAKSKSRPNSGVPRRAINWVYIDQSNKTMRSLLIMRIKISGNCIYFVEPSRRQIENPKVGIDKEESFRGLAFKLDVDDELDDTLLILMNEMPMVSGVMKNVLSRFRFPGDAYAYKHSALREKRNIDNNAEINSVENTVSADLYLLAVKKALSELNISI